jgi:hypothetical protein
MNRTIAVQMTPEGLLVPHAAVAGWTEIEVIKRDQQIVIRPKRVSAQQEWETMVQALRQARLTSPLADTLSQQAAPISPARRAELAQAMAVGRPLSEIVIEERAERW